MKLTKEQFRELLKKGNVSVDYEHSILTKKTPSLVAGLPAAQPQQDVRRQPEAANAPQTGSQGSDDEGIRFRVLLVRCGRKTLDSDNLAGSFKHVRDQIAAELGIDDGDPAIEWEYDQIRTRGAVGCIVRIERL